MSLNNTSPRFTVLGRDSAAAPRCPGVYRFLDKQARILYIGKSINMRDRVRNHFAAGNQTSRQRRLIHATVTVDCRPTAGEAGALLLENMAIKREMPLYNRRQRKLKRLWSIGIAQGKQGFLVPRLHAFSPSDVDVSAGYGLFTSQRAAQSAIRKLLRAERLCALKLELEHGRAPCFQYQLARCKGACAGRETAQQHNERLLRSLQLQCMSAWPITQPVFLHETSAGGVQPAEEWHLLHNWAYLGTFTDRAHAVMAQSTAHCMFDRDTYFILRRVLQEEKAQLYCATSGAPVQWTIAPPALPLGVPSAST